MFQSPSVVTQKNLATLPFVDPAADRPDIEYRDGQIVSGTLDALVDMLQPEANKSFKFTFILCSRLVLRPYELLSKLCVKYFKNYDRLVSVTFSHLTVILVAI